MNSETKPTKRLVLPGQPIPRIAIIQRAPNVDIHSTEDMRKLIDKLFLAIEVARFPPDNEECPIRVIFWLSGQPTIIWLMVRASKNRELIDYFETKRVEMIKLLESSDKKYRPLLQELKRLTIQSQ